MFFFEWALGIIITSNIFLFLLVINVDLSLLSIIFICFSRSSWQYPRVRITIIIQLNVFIMLKNFAWNRFIHNYLNSFKYIFSGTQETAHKGINKYLIYIRHIYLFNYIFYYLYDIKDILYYKGKETHKDELVKIMNKIKSSFPKKHFFCFIYTARVKLKSY